MMQSQKRQKMCWNCEGAISSDAVYCLYCGADMRQEMSFKGSPLHDQGMQEPSQDMGDLSTLYKPPYVPHQRNLGLSSFQEEKPMQDDFYYSSGQEQKIYPKHEEAKPEDSKKSEAGLWPLLFLSLGANLLTLGLVLFFFSDQGKLVLEWNSYYWFVYCILALPPLVLGWKFLQSSRYQDS